MSGPPSWSKKILQHKSTSIGIISSNMLLVLRPRVDECLMSFQQTECGGFKNFAIGCQCISNLLLILQFTSQPQHWCIMEAKQDCWRKKLILLMSGHKLWQTKKLIDDKLCLIHQILEARVQSQFEEAKKQQSKNQTPTLPRRSTTKGKLD